MGNKSSVKKSGNDGMAILTRRYLDRSPRRKELLARIRSEDAVGRKIYELRTKAGLSQRELAKLVGTTASVICRLEDAEYRGHSLAMLHRIALALGKELQISFVSRKHAA